MSSTAFFHTIFRYGISSPAKNADAAAADRPASLGQSVSFRVNEAFPAAFSGSLNLMKLRPFQSVRQAPLVRLVTEEQDGRGRRRGRNNPRSCGFFFPPSLGLFSPTFFYFPDVPQAEVKCYVQRECRPARSGRGEHSSIEVLTPAAILEANSILFCIPHLKSRFLTPLNSLIPGLTTCDVSLVQTSINTSRRKILLDSGLTRFLPFAYFSLGGPE